MGNYHREEFDLRVFYSIDSSPEEVRSKSDLLREKIKAEVRKEFRDQLFKSGQEQKRIDAQLLRLLEANEKSQEEYKALVEKS